MPEAKCEGYFLFIMSENAGQKVKILNTQWVTHNVRRFQLEKPAAFRYIPGQATDVSISREGWEDKLRPFTFTSLNDWDFLEFTIKIYTDHNGVTNELGKLQAGDSLIIHDVWGTIHYEKPGVFIAGGAGITPFIAILRQLHKDNKMEGNKLIFSNRTEKDIILREEFENMLGDNFINLITGEPASVWYHKRIDSDYLKKLKDEGAGYFYICGPDPMVDGITQDLKALGVAHNRIIREEF